MTQELEARLLAHMGLADMGEVLRDCRKAAAALQRYREEKERLREALDWAISEIDGRTVYQTETQYINALDCARAALNLKDTTDD
jgi:hypothetical protein